MKVECKRHQYFFEVSSQCPYCDAPAVATLKSFRTYGVVVDRGDSDYELVGACFKCGAEENGWYEWQTSINPIDTCIGSLCSACNVIAARDDVEAKDIDRWMYEAFISTRRG